MKHCRPCFEAAAVIPFIHNGQMTEKQKKQKKSCNSITVIETPSFHRKKLIPHLIYELAKESTQKYPFQCLEYADFYYEKQFRRVFLATNGYA